MMTEDDARDLAISASIDLLIQKIMQTNAFTRLEVVERFEAFCEAEREEMREQAERAQRQAAEARA